jgi:hypothetical protein
MICKAGEFSCSSICAGCAVHAVALRCKFKGGCSALQPMQGQSYKQCSGALTKCFDRLQLAALQGKQQQQDQKQDKC